MSLHTVPSGERVHISFFGRTNAGKSSLVNAITGQQLSLVSSISGTTTDPVRKAMELFPLGPALIIDTPGLDDDSDLGALRMEQTRKVISETDIAVLVIEAGNSLSASEQKLIDQLSSRSVPYIMVETKADLMTESKALQEALSVSSKTGAGIEELKQKLGAMLPEKKKKSLLEDLVSPGDLILLVIPVDASAPKGRLILPQQQTMREILDLHASFISCQTEDLLNTLAMIKGKPSLIITDSQAFGAVSRLVPEDIPLTSFSILFARYKGDLALLVQGAAALSSVTDESRVLISEGCTHHRQCNDIGTVKLPGWIEKHSGSRPQFSFTSGRDFPDDISGYDLIVHCGGCMLNEKEMRSRLQQAKEAGIPIVNYGTAIACMHGLLERSLRPFRKEHALLKP